MQIGHFSAIDGQECRELLRHRQVGRVGWTDAGEQYILPVTYRSDGGTVVYRTAAESVLARLSGPVAFEIDDIDEETRTGWSVLVRGTIEVTAEADVEPWAPGERDEARRITISSISGRSVSYGTEGGVDAYA